MENLLPKLLVLNQWTTHVKMFSFAYGKWIGNNTFTCPVDHSVILNHKQISRNRNESETSLGSTRL